MRIEQLRCLVDIAQTHSITNTAQRLFMTQQAVSSRIKQLEQDLGIAVLVRTNAGVHLTADGEEIVAYAKQILELEQEMEAFCRKKQEQYSRETDRETFDIHVCSTSSVANIVLPDIVAKLNTLNRKVSLKISLTDDMDTLLQQVQDGLCDIGFFTYNERELQKKYSPLDNILQLEVLARDTQIAVTDRRFCKEGQEFVTRDDYLNRIITLYNMVPIDASKEMLQEAVMISSNDADFHRRMIEKNGAIVVMPTLAYQYFFSAKKYVGLSMDLKEVPLVHGAIYRRDADARLKEFADMIRYELYIK